ncbi:MAG: cyanophycinase [Leptolyngbya sp. SIO3F4]|nr:cyanophycinase [Leptolyngbya sp. SIO3F4]
MKNYSLFFIICLFLSQLSCQKAKREIAHIGPENGTLVIVGGAMKSDSIINRFIELAGGIDASFVVIPTASGRNSYDENAGFARTLRQKGATNVHVLHTTEKEEANSETFTEPLLNANAVWFGGGRQWRLVDSYKNTMTEKMIHKVLERGGVVGGSSAGATIQGSYLARGDTKNNQIMMGDHEEGFSFLKNVAIDQHVLARNRQFDLYEILKARPELLGIGIDENTAIVVQQNEFTVIGESYVLVYDGTFWSREGSDLKTLPEKEKLFYFLREGDQYDLLNRNMMK